MGSTCEIKKDFLQDSVICKSSGKSKSVHLWSASSERSTHLDWPNNNLVVKTITDRQLSLSMCKSCKPFESPLTDSYLIYLILISGENIYFLWRNPSLPNMRIASDLYGRIDDIIWKKNITKTFQEKDIFQIGGKVKEDG